MILPPTALLPLNPDCYNSRVICLLTLARRGIVMFCILMFFWDSPAALGQGTPSASTTQKPDKTPQIKINLLNVCTPPESKELSTALNKLPSRVSYSGDFEVTRGRLMEKDAPSKYVRLRREITGDPLFSNVQYSISNDEKNTTETLVFKARDPKDLLLVSIEDQISATAAKPASVLDADTPATHIKLERFGKSSIALARCENSDQSAYEPLFAQATKLMAQYRKVLGLRTMFRSDLAWLSAPSQPALRHKTSKLRAKPAGETNASGKHLK